MDLTARGPFSLLAKAGLASPQAAGIYEVLRWEGSVTIFIVRTAQYFMEETH